MIAFVFFPRKETQRALTVRTPYNARAMYNVTLSRMYKNKHFIIIHQIKQMIGSYGTITYKRKHLLHFVNPKQMCYFIC